MTAPDRMIALTVAALGSAVYFVLAFGFWPDVGAERIGTFVYNYYFLALTEGRFDVPMRIVSAEGHYDAEGLAYVYHGIAPLITRAIAWPFVDLAKVSLAPLTIWLAAVGGTAIYHLVFVQIIATFAAPNAALQGAAGLVLGIMIWFASPGLLLVANDSMFHEPIAMAYLFVACFLGILARVVLFQKDLASALTPLAVFAGLCLFARPHLAVGLYMGVGLLTLVMVWRKGWQEIGRAAGTMGILLLFGIVLLLFNELRFGNMLQMHGAAGTAVEQGFNYWGIEAGGAPHKSGFVALKSFDGRRILPNLVLYLFDVPVGPVAEALQGVARYMTSGVGYKAAENPKVGIFYLWLPWFVLAVAGIGGQRAGLRYAWAPVLATAIGGLLMASYVTVTFRYRVDLWPILVALAMLALPRVLLELKANQNTWIIVGAKFGLVVAPSLILMFTVARGYAFYIAERGIRSRWPFETCAELVTAKQGLGPDAVARLCGL